MKLKKSLVTPVALLLTAAGLVACGGVKGDDNKDSEKFDPISATTEKPKGKVVFWSNIYGDSETAYAERMIAGFNEIYPDIEVEFLGKGRYGDIDKTVHENLMTPELLPNLVIGYPDYFTTYMDRLVDLRPYMFDEYIGFGKKFGADNKIENDATTAYDDLYAQYLEEGKSYNAHGVYSLPYGKSSEAFFINDSVFGDPANGLKAPTNWKEAIDAAKKYKTANSALYTSEKPGVFAPISFHSTSNLYITFSEMLGIPYASNVDANGDGRLSKKEAVLFNNPQAKAMVKQFKKWFNEGLFTTKDIAYAQGGSKYVENDFVKKNPSTIMMYDSTKGSPYVANSIKNDAESANNVSSAHSVLNIDPEYLTNPNYTPSAKHGKVMDQGGSIAMFDKGEAANKCAWLFYKYITSTDAITDYVNVNVTAPLRKSCLETESFKAITNQKGNKVTKESTKDAQLAKLQNEIFDLYTSYATNDQLMRAPVNFFSGTQRSACENMFVQIMVTTANTDAEIDALINTEFDKAYNKI